MSQKIIQSLPLCSRCIVHEINNWVLDKSGKINPEVTQKVREELKSIKLKEGNCLVCESNLISDNCFENILKIFEKHKVNDKIKKEFTKLFGFAE